MKRLIRLQQLVTIICNSWLRSKTNFSHGFPKEEDFKGVQGWQKIKSSATHANGG